MSSPIVQQQVRPQTPCRRSSIESTSSAAERLRWRNHPEVTSPGLNRSNPFEDDHVVAQNLFPTISDNDDFENEDSSRDHYCEKQSHGRKNQVKRGAHEQGAGDRGVLQGAEKESDERQRLSWRERIRHFTWTWFCMTMATGGIANVLYTGSYTSPLTHNLQLIAPQYLSAFAESTPSAAFSSSLTLFCSFSTLS